MNRCVHTTSVSLELSCAPLQSERLQQLLQSQSWQMVKNNVQAFISEAPLDTLCYSLNCGLQRDILKSEPPGLYNVFLLGIRVFAEKN